jgi:hypothetical protein
MQELPPIRKIIDGVGLNTDSAYCFFSIINVVSGLDSNNQLKHRQVVQSLYQNSSDNRYFLAYWNKMQWNESLWSYDFVNDISLLEPEQAKQWMLAFCKDKKQFNIFMESMKQPDKPASMTTISVRMPTELRDHLAFVSGLGNQSINKICMRLIETGLAMNEAKHRICHPTIFFMTMLDGCPVVDEFEKALKFEDPEEQALAEYAETLLSLYRYDYPNFLPFVARTFHIILFFHKKNRTHTICFAYWLSCLYRLRGGELPKSPPDGPQEMSLDQLNTDNYLKRMNSIKWNS